MSLQRRSGAVLASVIAVALVAVLAGGCGSAIDDTKVEGLVTRNLEETLDKKVSSVECPSGVDIVPGDTFECTVTLAGGKKEIATLEILNEDADLEIADLGPEKQQDSSEK